MVEDDTFTYHGKRQPADRTDTAAHSLITKERMQKLDLLIHLLSNLTQALVVCGPNGIGKTTLLNALHERKTESWRYCFLQGNTNLSFEAIQAQLILAHQQSLSKSGGQAKQVVLIVDNAGELVPGLIAAIIQYATANPLLRVVFALTHDELQVKRGSDRVVDDCHIVEIPTLSEKQCGDFLRYLSTKPALNVSFKAVSDNMIAHIYRETHGVPGRIIAEVSGLSGAKPSGKLKWLLALVPVALALAFGIQWMVKAPNTALAPVPTQPSAIALPAPMPISKDSKAIEPNVAEQKIEAVSQSQVMPALPPVVQQQSVEEHESLGTSVHQDTQQPTISSATSDNIVISQLENSQAVVIEELENKPKPSELSKPINAAALEQPFENKPSVGVQKNMIETPATQQEKPSELSKTAKNATPAIDKKLAIKPQIEPTMDTKAPEATTVKMAERLWAKEEQLKQAELSKAASSIKPPTANPQQPTKTEEPPRKLVTEMTMTTPKKAKVPSVPARNNFTLQLMVLSKQASANSMLRKYPAMRPDFIIIKAVIKGQEKFILNYGAYPDALSANKARQSLPFEFRNALVRKITSTDTQ